MSKLNFSIALKMTTEQFKRGADVVKRGIKNIQYQVLGMASALGVGALGLKGMVSQFVNVARETNRARVALKNVSGDANGFATNMNFLIRTSSKWGQELNGMTSEFAKFSAAATSGGVSMADQQYVFDAFTRSITAFGLSSDEAHYSYLALSQMMSKGKVSSEELRRQLGEKMPIAMEAMARAAGVSIQELDKLLSGGKLLTKDIIVPFMKEMENMIPSVDTDNIETSVNRLKNTFTKLTQDLKVGDIFKGIVDGANKMLGSLQSSFARIATVIVASIAGSKIGAAFLKLNTTTSASNARMVAEKQRAELQMEVATAKRVAAEKRYADLSVIYNKNANNQTIADYSKLQSAKLAMNKAIVIEDKARLAMEQANAAKSTTIWTSAWKNIKNAAVSAFATIKTMMASIVPMAIIGVITNFVMRLREIRKEAKEISNIFSDYQKESQSISTPKEVAMLEASLSILNDKKSSQEELNAAQSTLNSFLGTEISNQEELNKKVRERIALLRASAEAEFYTNKNISATDERDSIVAKYGGEDKMYGKLNTRSTWSSIKKNTFGIDSQLDLDIARVNELNKVIGDTAVKIENAVKSGSIDTTTTTTTPTTPTGDPKESPLEKAEKKYAEELTKLANQKSAGAIKEDEYNKAIDALNKATYEEIAGILGVNAERNKTFQLARQGVENQLSVDDKLLSITNDYSKSLKELDNKKRLGLISEDGYNRSLLDLINSTIDKTASLENVGKAEEEYIESLKNIKTGLVKEPIKGNRDTTFDYKKTQSEIQKEEVRLQERYLDDIKSKYKDLGDYGVKALEEIQKEEENLTSLSDALKIAELKEDINELNLDIFSASADGISSFANSIDRISKSWSKIASEDMSGFERIMAIMKAMGDTIRGLTNAWEAYNTIKDLIATREAARLSLETTQNIANDTATTTSALAKSSAVVAGLKAEEAAATGVMAAGSTAAYAAMPFVGVGLATAQIAAMKTLIASTKAISAIPGFAQGGIVGGNSMSGDKVLARVNSGEMILNSAQQSGLWNAINSGSLGSSGDVKFKIEGSTLVGVLNNYNKKIGRR